MGVKRSTAEANESTKRQCYESYCADVRYKNGDNAKPMTYEEWCKESEKLGESYGVYI